VRLQGYTDSDWEGSTTDRLSTSRCCFSLGSVTISGISRKQVYISLGIAKTEYIASNVTICEAVWFQILLAGLFDQELEIKYHFI
jgi:hypothetical protein